MRKLVNRYQTFPPFLNPRDQIAFQSLFKYNIEQLIDPITSILNKSLAEGTFPDLLKLASVCPIYKTNDRTKCANYRQISLL